MIKENQVHEVLSNFCINFAGEIGERKSMVCAPVRRDNPRALASSYLTCTIISSVDLAHYGVSRAKDWVSGGLWYTRINANLLLC